ncbi:MAG: PHB depolymerase family esterase [Anaerolineae bacterium]
MWAALVAALLMSFAGLSATAQPPAPGDSAGEIESGGVTRTYRLHLPPDYDADGPPLPLVINLHGLASNAAQQEGFSGMSEKADEAGFVVAHPQGRGAPARWNMAPETGPDGEVQNPDVVFIRALVAHLQATLNIDPARIYVTGMSNGGGMANRLGCDMADVFAAIAPVAGAYALADQCAPARPVPVIAFHGADDPIVPYDGVDRLAFSPGLSLPPVPAWAADWAARNGCAETPAVAVTPYAEGDVTVQTWDDCDAGAEVTLYTIDGLGHVWPGGARIPLLGETGPIRATDLIWAFFETHPMPEAE